MAFDPGGTLGEVPVRTASFEVPDYWLVWAEARLYPDRLVLSGYYFWGRYHRTVPLDRIESAEAAGRALRLRLDDGSSLRFRVPNPEDWARAIPAYRDV